MMPRLMLEVALAALGSLSSSFQPSHGAFVGVTHSKIRASHGARGRVRVWSDPMAVGRGNEFRQAILQSGKVIVMGHSNDDCQSSHIVSVTSNNLAGMINNDDKESSGIQIDFGSEPCFVAVTGESGTGKSLLISKAIDLVSGGKAISSFVSPLQTDSSSEQDSSSSVELRANLYEPHLSAISVSLKSVGVDPSILFQKSGGDNSNGQLHVKRTLILNKSGRLKSVCRINDKHLSLKSLRKIVAPLFTRVDVGVASAALGRPASRLSMIDMGVPDSLKQNCAHLRDNYKQAIKIRQQLKCELESRVLPTSLERGDTHSGFDEDQLELLEHWIDELDAFELRINKFRESVLAQYGEFLSSEDNANNVSEYSGLINILQTMKQTSWTAENNISDDLPFFTILLDFREETKVGELQLVSAQSAHERLTSLSSPDSAAVALEKVRHLLYDISRDSSGPVFDKVEETHELLNAVEVSLNKCARSIDGNSDSVVSILENMVCTGISIEEVDSIIADWNSLARKHGIPPSSLPNCHKSLREELDGNVEALNLLPEAEKDERIALEHFSNASKELSDARIAVAASLSESVSNILPVLGLEGTTFQVKMRLRQGGFDKPYHGTESLGVDIADFLLLHRKQSNTAGGDFTMMQNNQLETQHGGEIEQVGSSGEKSRVLLAIETSLPGSIGSTCNAFSNSADNEQTDNSLKAPPISIIYDEIDAHVGGRAAVTMAKLLANQSRRRPNSLGGNQIIAITHSASIAAIADRHIVVERSKRRDFSSSYQLQPIKSYVVDGSSRRKEIARMASGDLAPGEAEIFADALIRDGLIQKESPLFSE